MDALDELGPCPEHRHSFVERRAALEYTEWINSSRDVRDDGRSHQSRRIAETVSAEDLEKYETEMELSLYKEYRDIVAQFSYVVETERRFYLANSVELLPATRTARSTSRCGCPTRGCGTCTARRGS